MAASRKVAKYSALEDQYIFQPIAVESVGPVNCDARKFLADLGRRISRVSGTTEKPRFCFNAFLFCYFVSIPFCCTTVLNWTTQSHI